MPVITAACPSPNSLEVRGCIGDTWKKVLEKCPNRATKRKPYSPCPHPRYSQAGGVGGGRVSAHPDPQCSNLSSKETQYRELSGWHLVHQAPRPSTWPLSQTSPGFQEVMDHSSH